MMSNLARMVIDLAGFIIVQATLSDAALLGILDLLQKVYSIYSRLARGFRLRQHERFFLLPEFFALLLKLLLLLF